MTRRTEPTWKSDAPIFGVRVRFLTPENGFGNLPDFHAWLRREVGEQYAIHPAGVWPQASFLYLNDVELAARAVREFGLVIHGMPKVTGPSVRGFVVAPK